MKISVSNIAWDKENDGLMYAFLADNGIQGLEIAPTRLFENPYDNLEMAHIYAAMLKNRYGLEVCKPLLSSASSPASFPRCSPLRSGSCRHSR